jgi:hypothetical protein
LPRNVSVTTAKSSSTATDSPGAKQSYLDLSRSWTRLAAEQESTDALLDTMREIEIERVKS